MSDKSTKLVAIVLGGTVPHCELVRNLQRRGYYVILIDYLEAPPAASVAEEHLRESTLDLDCVLGIARARKASVVISACIDQANVTACYVMEQLGLEPPYSYDTSLLVSNKLLMKRRMMEAGIATSKYVEIKESGGRGIGGLSFPVIVKPADSNSSKGVCIAEDRAQMEKYVEEALLISRSSEAIVEEFVTGVEIGVDCYVFDEGVRILMTKERRKFHSDCGGVQQIYGCIWPAKLSADVIRELLVIASKIAKAFNLKNTPLMIQGILNSSGFSVIEFAPRIGGGESFRLIKTMTGFDFVDSAVCSFLRVEPPRGIGMSKYCFADNFIYVTAGRFDRIDIPEELEEDGTVDYVQAYRRPGTMMGAELSSNNRVGVFAVKAATYEELYLKINRAQCAIEVYDTDGFPMMRRDIYKVTL